MPASKRPTNCSHRLSKSSSAKRVSLPRASEYSRSFLKDWDRLARSGRYDMRRLREIMMLLVLNDGPLPPERLDHPLKGDWLGYRECHIGGDFLLIYQLLDRGTSDAIGFVRAGTHSELFRE